MTALAVLGVLAVVAAAWWVDPLLAALETLSPLRREREGHRVELAAVGLLLSLRRRPESAPARRAERRREVIDDGDTRRLHAVRPGR